AASRATAVEQQPMSVGREIRSVVLVGGAVWQVQHREGLWLLPWAIDAIAFGDPQVETGCNGISVTTRKVRILRAIRAENECQPIFRQGRVHIVASRIDG